MKGLLAWAAALGVFGAAQVAWGAETPAAAPPAEADEGFVAIFNGKDLTGWDGSPDFWSVQEGVIRGETTAEKRAPGNTFCIWRGGVLKNFVLKLKFRIQNGNSGVQYRSQDRGKWSVSGYQAEVCNSPAVGFLYHERGRGGLANVGDFVVIDAEGKKEVVGKVADPQALRTAGVYQEKDWNEYTIVARGNHLMQFLNGVQTIELIDNDPQGRAEEGILALQIHAGPPMVVEFKDIRLRHLKADYGEAVRLFNGKDLTGWVPSSEALAGTFGVKDGALTDSGRPAGYLRTKDDFANYVFTTQVRHVQAGNGGVLLRMTGPDKVWPKSIECQGLVNRLGDILTIDGFALKGDPTRSKGRVTPKMHPSNERPVGEWNRYEMTLDGAKLEIVVNGLVQNTATESEEVPGKICLQSEGGVMEYRSIVLIPIARPKP